KEITETGKKLNVIRNKIKDYCRTARYAGGELELLLNSFNPIRPLRYLNHEEIMQQKWGFLDIETPGFNDPDGGDISWAGLSYVQNGVPVKKEVHTLSKLPKKFYKGYEVLSHGSEEILLTAERDSIRRENPLFLSAYNAKYDFLNSRNAHPDFDIGEDDTRPRMEVHIKNLERVGINGRLVIDLYRWAQIAFPKLPNYRLETVAKHIFGEGKFKKKLGEEVLTKDEHYAKLAVLDKEARAGNMQAAETNLNYVADDVDILPEILNNEQFQQYLKHAAWISQEFKIPLSHLFYSLRSINKTQDEDFLKVLKLPRTETRRMDEKSKIERKKAQTMFRNYLEGKLDEVFEVLPKGPVSDVAIAHVPYGYYLRHLIKKRFPKSDEIYKRQADSNLSDFERLIYAQFGNTLAEYLITDYGILRDRKIKVINYEHQLTFGKEKEFEKLNGLLESQLRNVGGNYDVRPREIEDTMNLMGGDIVNILKKNNASIISHEGSFVYIKGDKDVVFSNSPLIKVASLGDALITIKNEKQRVIYEKYGTFNKRSSKEKTMQLPFKELSASQIN
ncbi:MAG: 3'-5' exonuclease, partial [Nanoarchaeota archaeon]